MNYRWCPLGTITHLLGVFFPISTGSLSCSCWMSRTCVPGLRAGWCSTSRPPATTGWWIGNTTWGCDSTWRRLMVSLRSLPAASGAQSPGAGALPAPLLVPWWAAGGVPLTAILNFQLWWRTVARSWLGLQTSPDGEASRRH